MKHPLINTQEYLIIIGGIITPQTTWYYNETDGIISNEKNVLGGTAIYSIEAHLPLNGVDYLEGVDVLPEIEENINQKAKDYLIEQGFPGHARHGLAPAWMEHFYNKAKEVYKFTEADLIKVISIMCENYTKPISKRVGQSEIIESLNQPKLPIAFECEKEYLSNSGEWKDVLLPSEWEIDTKIRQKTITNSEGRTEWVGTYIFE